MFKQLFEAMNEMLDEIIVTYPTANGAEKSQLTDNLSVLKAMSDTYIEEWLLFEEKLGKLTMKQQVPKADTTIQPDELEDEAYERGQGYYKLLMFEHAAGQFEQVVEVHPDFLMARLYMALCYYQMGKHDEAYRHFQWVTSLTEDVKIQAVCFHNMGCIQAEMENMEKACEYFEKALEADPSASFYSLS
jgi:tetratricopeptide (TPR) repeat protein